jgi:hypothetical protein
MGKGEVCIIIRITRANRLFIACIISPSPIGSLHAGGAGVELNQIGALATSRDLQQSSKCCWWMVMAGREWGDCQKP